MGVAVGTTPAYAGRTARALWYPRSPWDNPRVCGTDADDNDAVLKTAGQPPRMRDGRDSLTELLAATGTTPAYAGRTPRPTGRTRR